MFQVQAENNQQKRRKALRIDTGSLITKNGTPGENLVQFVKLLDGIKITPESLEFNSKYIQAPDGSKIEY